mmetsp:Transcript_63807/g.101410  ORF Transcript_63807/g.101410 Transcript_63807/m.101410 type:complete len:342 (-) Transcript_63807:764-1789(-)
MDSVFCVVLLEVVNLTPSAITLSLGHLTDKFFVVLRPFLDWQFSDVNLIVGDLLDNTSDLETTFLRVRIRNDAALESAVPRTKTAGAQLFLLDELPQHGDDIPGIVVWQRGGPSSANSISSIHQCNWNHRNVPFRLDGLPLLILKLQERIISRMEDSPSDALQPGVDVSCARMVLATLQSGTKLSRRNKQVDVVGTNEVLRHAHNGTLQRRFTVVISTVFCNIASKLSNLDVRPEVPLEGGIQNLPLPRLHSIHKAWNGSHHIIARESHQLLVDKVRVAHRCLRMVNSIPIFVAVDPFLSIVCPLLVEGQVNQFVVIFVGPSEDHPVILDVFEILLAFFRG